MKKNIFVIAVLLTAMSVMAKDYKVVVRGTATNVKGKTEVTVDQSNGSDSIIVAPGLNVTDIQVTVSSVSGGIISHYLLPATGENELDINTPNQSDGCLIEVKDNTGIVYADID